MAKRKAAKPDLEEQFELEVVRVPDPNFKKRLARCYQLLEQWLIEQGELAPRE